MPQIYSPPLDPPASETDYLRWEREPEWYRPDYDRSITSVVPTMLNLLGISTGELPTLLHHLPESSPRRSRRALLLTLDGFGFEALSSSSRFQAIYREYGTWITSVFPSITSAAITSIYQGLPPARHGIAGHLIWKDLPGGIVDMLRMQVVGADVPLAAAGFDVNGWKREPGILDKPLSEGLQGMHLMPKAIVGSGLSTFCYGQTRLFGFAEPVEGLSKAARMLSDISTGFVGMYLATLDSLGHVFGADNPQISLAVRQIEEGLQWMATTLEPEIVENTVLIVATDHGQSTIRQTLPLEGADWKWLEENTRAIGFSGRVMHVYLGSAGETAARERLQALVGAQGVILDFGEAAELAGGAKGDSWLRQSLGDMLAVLHDGINWLKPDPPTPPFPYDTPLAAQHGAMSRQEMLVPLIVAPLSVLLGN